METIEATWDLDDKKITRNIELHFEGVYSILIPTRYGPMFVYKEDNMIGISLLFYGDWCHSEMITLSNFIRRNDTIFDVGCNIGAFTLFFAKCVTEGKVYAFDPCRFYTDMTTATMVANGINNAVIYNQSIGDRNGSIKINLPDLGENQNFGEFKMVNGEFGGASTFEMKFTGDVEEVMIETLNSMVDDFDKVNLLKIDTEGMETVIINNGLEFIDKFKPVMFFEQSDDEGTNNKNISVLNDLGYLSAMTESKIFKPDNFKEEHINIFEKDLNSKNILSIHKSNTEYIERLKKIGNND